MDDLDPNRIEDLMAYSNVPISVAVVSPETELVQMNGFAWTDMGIRVQYRSSRYGPLDDQLAKMRQMHRWAYWETTTPSQGTSQGE